MFRVYHGDLALAEAKEFLDQREAAEEICEQ